MPCKFYYINKNASSSVVSNMTEPLSSGHMWLTHPQLCPEFKGSVTFFFLSSDDFQLEVTVINVNSYIYTVCVKGLGAFYFQIEMNL